MRLRPDAEDVDEAAHRQRKSDDIEVLAMTRRHLLPLGTLAGLFVLILLPAASARSVSDYCRLFTKEDLEKTLNTHITEIDPGPMKVVLGAEGLHDQACVFIAGSRLLRITITETRSTEEAQRLYKKAVSGQSAVNAADAKPLAGIHDEAVLAGNTVEMRRQNLVVDFSLRDFVADDESGLALARTLAAKVAERISDAPARHHKKASQ
jgi:hypothetical protein